MSVCVKLVTVVKAGVSQIELFFDSSLVPPNCAYELYTSQELAALQANVATASGSSLTVSELFAYPTSDQLLQVFQIGFYLPLQVYLLAWVYGVLLSHFKTEV